MDKLQIDRDLRPGLELNLEMVKIKQTQGWHKKSKPTMEAHRPSASMLN